MREAHVPLDIQEALIGHAGGNRIHRDYGSGHSLSLLAHWIDKADPLGLDL